MKTTIHPIPAFDDNYIWCLHNQEKAVVVDPGEADPVVHYLRQHNLSLEAILITHHHYDHVGGVADLLDYVSTPCPVYGPFNPKIKVITHRLKQGQQVTVLGHSLNVMEVPGHTLDHIAYHNEEWLFCGDTLFSGGCGRMFEGTATQFYHSLQKIASLPASLKVYCTHEYTLANLAFACAVEPNNPSLQAYRQQAEQTRSQQQPTLPTSLERELEINPFLRVDIPEVVERLRTHDSDNLNDSIQRFAALRGWKDQF